MPELTASQTLSAPADAVWRLLEDFGAIERWWPRDVPWPIESVRIEGSGIGMIRHIRNRGATAPVSERLDLLDRDARVLVLSIVGARPLGISAYVAEGRVVPVDDHCRIDYRARFTVDDGDAERIGRGIRKTWELMFRGLEQAARG
jgi:hypothetical protein